MSRDFTEVRECQVCERDTPHLIHDPQHERDSSNDHSECMICGSYYDGWGELNREYEPPKTFAYNSEHINKDLCFVLALEKMPMTILPDGINHKKVRGVIMGVGLDRENQKPYWIVSTDYGLIVVTNEEVCRE